MGKLCTANGCPHPGILDGLCRDHFQLHAAGFDPDAVRSYRIPKVHDNDSKYDESSMAGMTFSMPGRPSQSGLTVGYSMSPVAGQSDLFYINDWPRNKP